MWAFCFFVRGRRQLARVNELDYNRVILSHRRSPRRSRRAFSLVELLAVVTISTILAVAGVAMFRRHIIASRGSEATSFLEAMRAAQAMYMAENHGYLDASTTNGGGVWYPQVNPSNQRATWHNENHNDWARWQLLPMPLNKTVLFSYLCNAGVPNTAMTKLTEFKSPPTFPVPQLDWYVLQAKGDTNGDNLYALYATTSLTNEIYSENEGE